MKGRSFSFFSLLSLFLAITAAIMWVRSYFIGEGIYRDGFSTMSLTNSKGQIRLGRVTEADGSSYKETPTWGFDKQSPFDMAANGIGTSFAGFYWYWGTRWYSDGTGGANYHPYILIPHWSIVTAALILPAWWMVAFCRRRRRQWREDSGLCPRCGYDLRASKERCPECGERILRPDGRGITRRKERQH
jgi:hypothetical protein